MENEIQKVVHPCVVCGSKEHSFFTRKNGCSLYRCVSCRLLFVQPLPADSAAVYSDDYFSGARKGFGYVDYDADKEPMIPVFKKYLAMIDVFLPERGRILDVGAATGFFLTLAQKAGWQVEGVELSRYAVEIGRRKGLSMHEGTLSDLVSPPESFRAITMFDLIEHLLDPAREISLAHRLLEKGGVLVVNTPDAGSLWARLFGRRWHLIVPPEHLHYFSRKNLTLLLSQSGFEVVHTTKVGKRFTLQYIFKMLYLWQRLPFWRRMTDFFHMHPRWNISLPINTRDNMLIIARKI